MGRRRALAERPVETGTIVDSTSDGRGIVKIEAKAIFVDAAISGELVSFRRVKQRRNYDEAELLEVQQPSAERVTPACRYFSYCGGCSLQHLRPESQLRVKEESLLQALERIGDVVAEKSLQPLAGAPLGYRRRARMGAKLVEKKGRVLVGFREKRKPYVADMASCETLAPELGRLIKPLSDLIEKLSISRQVPQIEMSLGDSSMALIFRVLESPSVQDKQLLNEFGSAHHADIYLQSGGPSTLSYLGPDELPRPLTYGLPAYGLSLEFGPMDFIQVNQDMNQRMIAQALDLLGPLAGLKVMDLFCGIGNFSLPLSKECASLIGVELDPGMVLKAQANAKANGIDNAQFVAADLTRPDELPELLKGEFDLVVLDPPRAGAMEVLAQVAATGAARILYISCHPGSLARDAGILVKEHGYTLKSAGAMDMFPQTSHVEAMALFEK